MIGASASLSEFTEAGKSHRAHSHPFANLGSGIDDIGYLISIRYVMRNANVSHRSKWPAKSEITTRTENPHWRGVGIHRRNQLARGESIDASYTIVYFLRMA